MDLTIHHGHTFYTVTRAFIRHANPTNVLIPLKMWSMKGSGNGCMSTPPRTWTLEDGFVGLFYKFKVNKKSSK